MQVIRCDECKKDFPLHSEYLYTIGLICTHTQAIDPQPIINKDFCEDCCKKLGINPVHNLTQEQGETFLEQLLRELKNAIN